MCTYIRGVLNDVHLCNGAPFNVLMCVLFIIPSQCQKCLIHARLCQEMGDHGSTPFTGLLKFSHFTENVLHPFCRAIGNERNHRSTYHRSIS